MYIGLWWNKNIACIFVKEKITIINVLWKIITEILIIRGVILRIGLIIMMNFSIILVIDDENEIKYKIYNFLFKIGIINLLKSV